MSWLFGTNTNAALRRLDNLGIAGVPLTISVWFKRNTTTNLGTQALATLGTSGSINDRFAVELRSDNAIEALTRSPTGDNGAVTAATVTDTTTWHHACGVFAAANSRFVYLDGANKASNSATRVPAQTNAVVVGIAPNYTSWDGSSVKIGPVAIWDVALSDAEVAQLAAGASAAAIQPGSLRGFWRNNVNADPAPENSGGTGLAHFEATTPIAFSADDPLAAAAQNTLLSPSPGLVLLSGGRPAITTSGPPTFLVQPSVAGRSQTSYTVAFSTSAAATIYGIAQPRGLAQPSVTQIIAGRDATGALALAAASKSVNGTDNLVLTLSGSPPFPVHDLYLLLTA